MSDPVTPVSTRHHLLMVLCREARGEELRTHLSRLATPAGLDLHLVAPALAGSHLQFLASDVDPGIRLARSRLARSIAALSPVPAVGEVGEADPLLAIDTALVAFPADEIMILPSARRDQWAEGGLFEAVRGHFSLPVREIELHETPDGVQAVETCHSLPAMTAR
jgi:hypothetical protein